MSILEINKAKTLARYTNNQGQDTYYFWCPGCKYCHGYPVPRWSYNGDFELPTFSPSLLIYYTDPETKQRVTCCHLFLTNGILDLLGDCPHDLKSKKIPLPTLPSGYGIGEHKIP